MFLGEFSHTIDDKGRITIPAKFRGKLAAGLVITKGIDPCLWLYPVDRWDVLAKEVAALPLTNPKAREFRRQVFGGAADSVPDKQGRINCQYRQQCSDRRPARPLRDLEPGDVGGTSGSQPQ
jgi:MraZ protein